jgi:hypothetical protein
MPWTPIILGVVFARLLAVDVGAVLSSDSLGYLTWAERPFGKGLVVQGYRQAAYPVFLAGSDTFARVVGWDRLLGVAVLQRATLVVAILLCWWALRLWAIPILVMVTSATYVVHVDTVLTEALLIPLCLIAGSIVAATTLRRTWTMLHPAATLGVLTAVIVFAAALKLQYASLLFLAVAAGVLLVSDSLLTKRTAIIVLATGVGLVATLAVAQAFENRSELGVFEPVSERARAEYYGAWQAVFTLEPSNEKEPALAPFYDDGDLFTFLHGIEASEPDYPKRARIIRVRIADMFDAAKTTRRHEQLASFLGTFRGGRFDDLDSLVDRALAADQPNERTHFNSLYKSDGEDGVLLAVNDGHSTKVVSVGGLFDRVADPLSDHRPYRGRVGIISLILVLIGIAWPGRQRLMCLAATLGMCAVGVAMASAYIDSARFLLGPLTVLAVAASASAASLAPPAAARAVAFVRSRRRSAAPLAPRPDDSDTPSSAGTRGNETPGTGSQSR